MDAILFDNTASIAAGASDADLQAVVTVVVDPQGAEGARQPPYVTAMIVEIINLATAPGDDLAELKVQTRPHKDSPWANVIKHVDGIASLITRRNVKSGDDLVTLVAGGSGVRQVRFPRAHEVRIVAYAAAGKTVSIRARGMVGAWRV